MDFEREDIDTITMVELVPPQKSGDEESLPCFLITDADHPINVTIDSAEEAEIILDAD